MIYDTESEGDPVVKDYHVIHYPKERDTICYISDFLRECWKQVDYDKLDI